MIRIVYYITVRIVVVTCYHIFKGLKVYILIHNSRQKIAIILIYTPKCNQLFLHMQMLKAFIKLLCLNESTTAHCCAYNK